MNPFNLFSKGVRKEEGAGKRPLRPELIINFLVWGRNYMSLNIFFLFVQFPYSPYSLSVSTEGSKEQGEDCKAQHCRAMTPNISMPNGFSWEVMVCW